MSTTTIKRFKSRLTSRGPAGAWTFLEIPFSVEEAFGSKARVPVSGTMNGFAFQNSVMPNGDGTHSMMVNKALQAGAKATAGDFVSVIMAIDRSRRVVKIPPELKEGTSQEQGGGRLLQGIVLFSSEGVRGMDRDCKAGRNAY